LASASATLNALQMGTVSNEIASDGVSITNQMLTTNGVLEISSGQSLGGIGSILASNVLMDAGSTLNAGLPTGTLSVNNSITLAGTVDLDLNRTSTPNSGELSAPTITVNPTATLVVTNVGPALANGDKFQLFSQPVSGFASITLPATDPTGLTNYTWTTNLSVDGSITLASGGVTAVATNPTNMTFSASGNTLTITWPGDHLGWALQSNSVSLTASNQWFTIPGSTTVTDEVLNIDKTQTNVFFRMQISH
jgi:hypothetical protein